MSVLGRRWKESPVTDRTKRAGTNYQQYMGNYERSFTPMWWKTKDPVRNFSEKLSQSNELVSQNNDLPAY